ncbi:MAG: hypothetical protein QOD51_2773 [Candidatus Eremiobacteraeota bacterium]|nr:hypothetical protein [Candidatus Eremiobacteraeota bacterium]
MHGRAARRNRGGDRVTALVPHTTPVARRGERALAQYASNGVAVDVRVEAVDKRNRCTWYALKLASRESDLVGRLVGVRRGGRIDELGSVEVMPESVGSARFAVTAPRGGPYESMYLEVWSGAMLLRVEAPQPPHARTGGALRCGAWLVGAGVAISAAAAMPLAFAHDAPHAAPVRAAVAVAQSRHALPAAAQAAPARVISFSARRDDAPGGDTVLASYLATGDRGTVALLDAAGVALTSGPFTRIGTIRLRVPKGYRNLPMTAQITVHRGATKAVSNVVVPPNAQATPRPAASPEPASSAVAAADTASSAGSSALVVVEGRAVAGRPLTLRVAPRSSPMRLELEDASGAVIAERDIAPNATRATLQLPPGTVSSTYLVALHYTNNGGEETAIRTLGVAAR